MQSMYTQNSGFRMLPSTSLLLFVFNKYPLLLLSRTVTEWNFFKANSHLRSLSNYVSITGKFIISPSFSLLPRRSPACCYIASPTLTTCSSCNSYLGVANCIVFWLLSSPIHRFPLTGGGESSGLYLRNITALYLDGWLARVWELTAPTPEPPSRHPSSPFHYQQLRNLHMYVRLHDECNVMRLLTMKCKVLFTK
jgi:hypothetical protein